MKKILAFLLTIVVVVAVFAPCCMYDNCQDDIVANQDTPKKSTEGACSPFSTCASCHGFTTTVEPIKFLSLAPEHTEYFTDNTVFVAPVFAISPWQPPRTV